MTQTDIFTTNELKCPCCDSTGKWKKKHNLPKYLFGDGFRIMVCQSCGCGATVPAPNSSYKYYKKSERYTRLFEDQATLYKKFAIQLLGVLNCIPNFTGNGEKLLDIGCGGGVLVQTATEYGFNALGIEANDELVASARNRGINVIQGDISQLKDFKGTYDVIILSAVLEHLDQPDALLFNCKRFLNPEGIVVISQASFDGLLPRLFPWGWYAWQPHEHYWHFIPRCLRLLIKKTGFEELYWRRNSLYHRWFAHGNLKEVIGRNIAYTVSKIGTWAELGDSFDIVIRHSGIDGKSLRPGN